MSQLIRKIAIEDNYIAARDETLRRLVIYKENDAVLLELAGIKDTVELAKELRLLAQALEDE